jgi:o-succinylbenzoate synthase
MGLGMNWTIWEYTLPLKKVLPASGEQRPIRKGYLIARSSDKQTQYCELAPLEHFHHIRRQDCLDEFIDFINNPNSLTERHSVTQFAIDTLALHSTQQRIISINALMDPLQQTYNDSVKGWNCIKIKLGRQPIDKDIQFFNALLEKIPQQLRLRIDTNQRWSVDDFHQFIESVPLKQIDYFEDPLTDPKQYINFNNVPIALDESIQSEYFEELLNYNHIIGCVIKPTVIGGLEAAKKQISLLESLGKKAIISSTFESSIGLWAISSLVNNDDAHGLGTLPWFITDLVHDSLQTINNKLHRSSSPPIQICQNRIKVVYRC